MTWLAHFGLACAPFSKELLDSDLWLPPSKQSVVQQICEAAQAREQILLTGEDGTGKTTVLRAVRQRLGERFRLTYTANSTLGKRDFYRQLCLALGLSPKATAAGVFYAVSGHVQERRGEHVHPVFLIDEAHLLHQDTVDHLQAGCEREVFTCDAAAMLHEATHGAMRDIDRVAHATLRATAAVGHKLVERAAVLDAAGPGGAR